eukprot:RCo014633
MPHLPKNPTSPLIRPRAALLEVLRGTRGLVPGPVVEPRAALPPRLARLHQLAQRRGDLEGRLIREALVPALQDAQAGVQPDVVRKNERAHGHVRASHHRHINVGEARHATLQHQQSLAKVGHQQAVHNEPWGVPAGHGLLLDRLAPVHRGLEGVIAGQGSPDDLNQLHHLDGVEEVQANQLVTATRSLAQLGDGERGGVRAEDGILLGLLAKLGEELLLDVQVLNNGLNNQVALVHRSHIARRSDLAHDLRRLILRRSLRQLALDHFLLQPASQGVLDHLHPLLQLSLVNINGGHLEPVHRGQLCNAVAHQTHPHHADVLDRHEGGGSLAEGHRY